MGASYAVHIRYPFEPGADDEAWLVDAVGRHGGELPEWVVLTEPGQRYPTFEREAAADAFAAELTATDRWSAHRWGGCPVCTKPS